MSNLSIGRLLRQLREKHRYNLDEIAMILGVNKSAVSKWEKGDDIRITNLYQLSKIYNVTVEELYEGKLKSDNSLDFLRIEFDLSYYDFDEKKELSKRNLNDIKEFYEHCKKVNDKFFSLLPKWAKNQIKDNELEVFMFIKRYFEFDIQYYELIKYGPGYIAYCDENLEKEFIYEKIKEIELLNNEQKLWELKKLYNFMYNLKIEEVINSNDAKVLRCLFSALSQIEKDKLLNYNLIISEKKEDNKSIQRKRLPDEIENQIFLKEILRSGAKKLYDLKEFDGHLNQEMYKYLKGKKKEVKELHKYLYPHQNFFDYWKLFSYDEYLELIDKEGTDYLKDIISLRDSDPLKYYENLEKRDFKF